MKFNKISLAIPLIIFSISFLILETTLFGNNWFPKNFWEYVCDGIGAGAFYYGFYLLLPKKKQTLNRKWFWLSIRKSKDCLFSRRSGHIGKIVFGYSICLRMFNRDIL